MYKDKDEAIENVADFLKENDANLKAMAAGKATLKEKQILTIQFNDKLSKCVDVRKYSIKLDDGTYKSGEWFAVHTLEGYEVSLARLIRLGNGLDFVTGMTNQDRVKSFFSHVWDANDTHSIRIRIEKIETRVANGREFKNYRFAVVD